MFVADDLPLIRNSYSDVRILVEDDALATQAAFEPGIDGAIDEILFFFRDFFQELFPFFDVHMTGRAGADAAAIVVQVHVVLFGQFQDGQVEEFALDGFGGDGFIFELKLDGSHGMKGGFRRGAKVALSSV